MGGAGRGGANFHSIKNYQKTIANTFWGNYQNKVSSREDLGCKNGEQSINT